MSDMRGFSFPAADAGNPLADPDLYDAVLSRRFWAWVLDQICILVLVVGAFALLVVTTVASFGLLTVPGMLIVVLVPFGYHLVFAVAARGTTLGMMAMRLVVRQGDGGEPEPGQAVIRFVVFHLSVGFLTPLVLLVALFGDRRRALHDLATGTVVVRDLKD